MEPFIIKIATTTVVTNSQSYKERLAIGHVVLQNCYAGHQV
jgi:hypothetical protein